jgi:pimeloyl-ACP methyl ester carboxylesterase
MTKSSGDHMIPELVFRDGPVAARSFVPKLQKTIMLPDCGHWTQQEKPNEVNSAIIAFLNGLTF